jgi:hypothetical protein
MKEKDSILHVKRTVPESNGWNGPAGRQELQCQGLAVCAFIVCLYSVTAGIVYQAVAGARFWGWRGHPSP